MTGIITIQYALAFHAVSYPMSAKINVSNAQTIKITTASKAAILFNFSIINSISLSISCVTVLQAERKGISNFPVPFKHMFYISYDEFIISNKEYIAILLLYQYNLTYRKKISLRNFWRIIWQRNIY